jgi:hypothetical protein
VKASELRSKHPVPALLPRVIDWASLSWPIHERYEQHVEVDPLTEARTVRLIPAGRHRSWQPAMQEAGLYQLIAPLAKASDSEIAEWVSENGLLGVDPQRRGPVGETTLEIRQAAAAYDGAARDLVEAARDVRRLPALLRSLQEPSSRLLRVQVVATDQGRLMPVLASHGPLSAAYQQLIGSATLDDVASPYHWRQPRECGQCGTWFSPTRRDKKYCRDNCVKRASDARRNAKVMPRPRTTADPDET